MQACLGPRQELMFTQQLLGPMGARSGIDLGQNFLGTVASESVKVLVIQFCLALFDPKDCSPSGSSVQGILQARILEWVVFPFSRGSSQCWNQPRSPAL